MKTTLLSIFAVGTCASVVLAEPVSPVAGSTESLTPEAHAAEAVALTAAEMDKVTAGYGIISYSRFLPNDNKTAGEALDAITEIITDEVSKGAGFVQR